MTPDAHAARRADIDAKQAAILPILELMDVEAAVLIMPAHVSWFTAGMNVRGMIADSERPAIFTNGKQRWLIASNVDSQRLFDEELDQLGFQLREWYWESGRSNLLASVTVGKKVTADRPFPNIAMINDHLRPLLRSLSAYEQEQYRDLGVSVAHAIEATARNFEQGQTEEEIAGQLGHRFLHHGIEAVAVSVTANDRGANYRRSGFGPTRATGMCVIQATGQRSGLYATCSRTVSFGPVPAEFRVAHDLAVKQAVVYRSLTQPGRALGEIGMAGRPVLADTPFEFDWRLSPPGYGAGRFPAEELRRGGVEEPLTVGAAVVWQPRVGPAAAVDTLIATDGEPLVVTPPEEWPVKRLAVRGGAYHDIPDVLMRE